MSNVGWVPVKEYCCQYLRSSVTGLRSVTEIVAPRSVTTYGDAIMWFEAHLRIIGCQPWSIYPRYYFERRR